MTDVQLTEKEPVSVLLVDDEENILRALQRLLMDEDDIEITTATSGEEGLSLLPTLSNLGLILSDQRMPGMGGAQFLEKARAVNPEASRIILTGYADVTAAVDAINKGGAWRYLAKPWNDNELLAVIREGLERYRIIVENRRLNALVLKQNQELDEWNKNLKKRVLEQTVEIRKKNEELTSANLQLKKAFNGIIASFAGLIDLRDRNSRLHSQHVREIADGVARDLELPEHERETIAIAAMLHDIGEIGIPEHVLAMRPADMSPGDFAVYRMHSVRGQTAIDAVESLRNVGRLIRHHHENYDGSGFPDNLAGDDIPLGARIIAYADFIDKGMQLRYGEEMLVQVLQQADIEGGRKLDPHLASKFRKIAKYTYFNEQTTLKNDSKGGLPDNELELKPVDLLSGMMVAQSIRSGTGLLLLKSGTVLDNTIIQSLQRYYQLDPPDHGVFICV